ncbi:MAG: hypothetical protein AAF514_21365, partial [Verrucomicrobiota bacterium]
MKPSTVVLIGLLLFAGGAFFPIDADERPLVQRGGIDGREFSEIGRLYVDDDQLVHFRSDRRLYYFSHMYYIREALARAGVVVDGRIVRQEPIRITGNYSKAAYVYNFLEEPAMRGSQILWIDRIEKVPLPANEKAFVRLFDYERSDGGSFSPGWSASDQVLSYSSSGKGDGKPLIS